MAITYSWVIKKLDTAEINGIQNVVSHIHFDYVGTDESGNTAFCQGAMPFELKTVSVPLPDGGVNTINAVFDPNNYTPFEGLTQEQVISWLEQNAPTGLISTFQNIISKKLQGQAQVGRSDLPWAQQGA